MISDPNLVHVGTEKAELVAPQLSSSFTPATRTAAAELLRKALELGVDFKLRQDIYRSRLQPRQVRDLLVAELPQHSTSLGQLLDEFAATLAPLCKNEASPHFLGFGDTGDDLAALAGGILSLFTQQNLINQSFDSPSATFVEIAVLRWLRELLGYTNPPVRELASVWDVGGVVTHGGTMSNTIAMMLAREHKAPGTMERGVHNCTQFTVIVPRGIGHYSVKSALTWIGVGAQVMEVDTHGYRYDLEALDRALRAHAGDVMAVVAYAGDSRTQTVENLCGVRDVVRSVDESIWLHADACWGLVAAFSDRLRPKIAGIASYDSVTVDPHKVMAVPYSLSALLVKDAGNLRLVSSYSDLIMQEDFAFGQVTPLVGTKGWLSLKLWMMMRYHGRDGLAQLADRRVDTAQRFADLVDASPRLLRLHEPDLAAVAFVYLPTDVEPSRPDIARVNAANRWIHQKMLDEGRWHLHQFSLRDDAGVLSERATLYPLRFLAGNPRATGSHLTGVVDYVLALGRAYEARGDR